MKNYFLLLPFLVCLSMSACQPTGKSSSTTAEPPCDRCAVIVDDIWSGLVGDGAKSTEALEGEPARVLALVKKEVENHNNHEQVKAVGAEMLVILPFEDYYFQLIPTLYKGDRVYFVNALCDPHGQDWKKEVMLVKDGGKCYFQMKVNVSKEEVYDFMINGNG